eukprot:6696997-Lingulodinium_polyedra.AAC.1
MAQVKRLEAWPGSWRGSLGGAIQTFGGLAWFPWWRNSGAGGGLWWSRGLHCAEMRRAVVVCACVRARACLCMCVPDSVGCSSA